MLRRQPTLVALADNRPAKAPDREWQALAACRVTSAVHFFPPNHHEHKPEKDRREAAARAVCRACPVRTDCLRYAICTPEPHGIWGGLNELERRRLQRRRRSA